MNPLDILKQCWGYSSFRPLQEEIIRSVLEEKDTLALLPTGGGKSVCFQIPALALEGICVVISPLIALMKDQVEQLQQKGIKAAAIFSGMKKREIDITLDNCIYGNYKFIYVSPERLKMELFLQRAEKMNICMLAVDEAHCISQWGYDFRKPYLDIAIFKKKFNIPKLIALTATATKEVKEDIIAKLQMRKVQVFQQTFARKNLSYAVFNLENKQQKLLEILKNVPGTSLIYVRSRKRTKQVADMLRRNHISADFYHAGLDTKERAQKQEAWSQNKTRVIVATNSFGMGIDKPDVRTVIHLDLPDSLEAYYQEAGRAGRDGRKAYAVTIFHAHDIRELNNRIQRSMVSLEELKHTYRALANYYKLAIGSHTLSSFPFQYDVFVTTYKLSALKTYAALKKLMDEGLIQLTDGFFESSKLSFLLDTKATYAYRIANPKSNLIIKTLMRWYGGEIFSSYVRIKEKEMAALLKTDVKQVRNLLTYLSAQKVVDYQPATDSPIITFLTPRLHPDKLPIDHKQIEWRNKQTLRKAKNVIDYIEMTDCRTQAFQHYFDEKITVTCGICDNDLNKKKQSPSANIPVREVEQLLEIPRTITELKSLLSRYKHDQIIEALRMLMEDERVSEQQGTFAHLKTPEKRRAK